MKKNNRSRTLKIRIMNRKLGKLCQYRMKLQEELWDVDNEIDNMKTDIKLKLLEGAE